MVDATKGIGQTQNALSSNNRNQVNETRERGRSENGSEVSSAAPSDEVNISQEASSLAEAENTASQIRAQLEADQDATLSRAGDLADFLA